MSTTIEWADASQRFTFLGGDDEAEDGNTPNGDAAPGRPELIGLVVEGCAIYGTPAELLELLSDGISQVSAHLAGQQ